MKQHQELEDLKVLSALLHDEVVATADSLMLKHKKVYIDTATMLVRQLAKIRKVRRGIKLEAEALSSVFEDLEDELEQNKEAANE